MLYTDFNRLNSAKSRLPEEIEAAKQRNAPWPSYGSVTVVLATSVQQSIDNTFISSTFVIVL